MAKAIWDEAKAREDAAENGEAERRGRFSDRECSREDRKRCADTPHSGIEKLRRHSCENAI